MWVSDDEPESDCAPRGVHPGDRDASLPDPDDTSLTQMAAKGGESESGATDALSVDLAALVHEVAGRGPVWTRRSEDLDVNLLVFGAGEGVAEHQNAEVDVLLVGIAGEGVVTIDSLAHPLRAGQAVLVPKGTRRGTQATTDRFAYLSCHRRRGGLLPNPRPPR